MIEWALLVVVLWYIADSAVYLYRYYSREGREAGRDSGQSPFKLIPAKIAGYNWVRCGGCGGKAARRAQTAALPGMRRRVIRFNCKVRPGIRGLTGSLMLQRSSGCLGKRCRGSRPAGHAACLRAVHLLAAASWSAMRNSRPDLFPPTTLLAQTRTR